MKEEKTPAQWLFGICDQIFGQILYEVNSGVRQDCAK